MELNHGFFTAYGKLENDIDCNEKENTECCIATYLPFICVYQWDLLVWVQASGLGLKAYTFLSQFK